MWFSFEISVRMFRTGRVIYSMGIVSSIHIDSLDVRSIRESKLK